MNTRRSLVRGLTLLPVAAAGFPLTGRAVAFGDQPVRIVVAAAAGSGGDTFARKLGVPLSAIVGQPVVIDNRPGANGIIAAQAVAKAKPDGHTVLFASVALLCMNPHLVAALPYDPARDFIPVTLAFESRMLLAVGAHVPVRTIADFIAYAKSRPKELTIGSAGEGSIQHMAAAQLEQVAGLALTHVHYAAGSQVILDLLAGRIDAAMDYASVIAEHVRSQRLFALAMLGNRRSPALPLVPTSVESGLAEWNFRGWGGFLVPAGTPRQAVEALSKAFAAALHDPQMVQWASAYGSDLSPTSPEEFGAYIRTEDANCARVAKTLNLKRR